MKVFTANSKIVGQECSICQTDILAGEQIVFCQNCQVPFHKECWEENGGCAQYGCDSAPQVEKQDAPLPMSNVWGDTKKCPSCRREIKASALKCFHCRASFDTRDHLTPAEYNNREYQDKEYNKARNEIVILFLLSATGCLSIFTVFVLGKLIFDGKALGLKFERLPASLKTLSRIGFYLSIFLLSLLVLLIALD